MLGNRAKQSKEILRKAGQRNTAQRRSANAVEWSGRAGALLHFPLSACPLLTEEQHHLHHEEEEDCDDEDDDGDGNNGEDNDCDS